MIHENFADDFKILTSACMSSNSKACVSSLLRFSYRSLGCLGFWDLPVRKSLRRAACFPLERTNYCLPCSGDSPSVSATIAGSDAEAPANSHRRRAASAAAPLLWLLVNLANLANFSAPASESFSILIEIAFVSEATASFFLCDIPLFLWLLVTFNCWSEIRRKKREEESEMRTWVHI